MRLQIALLYSKSWKRHRCPDGVLNQVFLIAEEVFTSDRGRRFQYRSRQSPERAQEAGSVFGKRNIGDRGGGRPGYSRYHHCLERLSGSALDRTSGGTVRPSEQ